MAKIIEEIIAIKIHRMIKDNDDRTEVLSKDQRRMLADGLPSLAEQIINDGVILVEMVDLD